METVTKGHMPTPPGSQPDNEFTQPVTDHEGKLGVTCLRANAQAQQPASDHHHQSPGNETDNKSSVISNAQETIDSKQLSLVIKLVPLQSHSETLGTGVSPAAAGIASNADHTLKPWFPVLGLAKSCLSAAVFSFLSLLGHGNFINTPTQTNKVSTPPQSTQSVDIHAHEAENAQQIQPPQPVTDRPTSTPIFTFSCPITHMTTPINKAAPSYSYQHTLTPTNTKFYTQTHPQKYPRHHKPPPNTKEIQTHS